MNLKRKTEGCTITEREFQQQILDLAKMLKWMGYFTWSSRHSPAGFPDLILLKDRVMVVAELKAKDARGKIGQLTPEQYEWLEAFMEITPFVYLWYPEDIEEIAKCLRY